MYNTDVISAIKDYMTSHHHTLAVAESVTSGHLQAALSLATDASKFFHGGITAYNLGQKARHLHINPIHATSCNSVSETIADEMALNAVALFSSDWAIGITGYASPLPEFGINDIFAFYAIAFRKEIVLQGKVKSEHKDPYTVQVTFANHVLKELHQHLLKLKAITRQPKANGR
jgi:nicotinamide-nucleotide amidase